ncbi:hypothetical protein GCM10010267_12030 [Streptomyces griseorubens]|nr:hypothetical protein GCM10010267_12030 [Streptomyces griseorubens]
MSTPAEEHAPGPASPDGTAARARGLTKAYGSGETAVIALDSVDVDVARGRFTAVMGPSGSGKSTLMHCLAGLDTVSAGQVWLGDTEITGLKDRELTRLRRDRVGFMFQSFNLIPTLNARENITLPMDIAGRKPDEAWLDQVIDTLGLRDRLKHRPAQLSGGQQQRVACARALASRPELIFADEPTGNLDSRAGLEVLGFLREAVDQLGQTVVMVTHDPGAAAHSDLVLFLADGRIVDETHRPTAESVLERMKRFDVVRGATVPDGAVPPGGALSDAPRTAADRPDAAPSHGGTSHRAEPPRGTSDAAPPHSGTSHRAEPGGGRRGAPPAVGEAPSVPPQGDRSRDTGRTGPGRPDTAPPDAAPSDAAPSDGGTSHRTEPDGDTQTTAAPNGAPPGGGRQGAPPAAGEEPGVPPHGDWSPDAASPGAGED